MTIEHRLDPPADPARVVLLGARGFIGSALVRDLKSAGVPTLPLASADLDLTAPDAGARLAELLRPDDALVFLSALTPDKGRDLGTFMRNLRMGEAVAGALQAQPVAHAVYMSSDAVYPYDNGLISETTPAAPSDLYGVMHRARELMLQQAFRGPLAILRCALVYGAADTHNSYGANRFRHMAEKERKIVLGGQGEETRDHVLIDDVVALIRAVLRHRSHGLMNLATGQSVTFDALARLVAGLFSPAAEVAHTPRQSPITHRHFDAAVRRRAFPDFRFTPLAEGLARVHREAFGG
ncbi:MAG: NAD-dependent epimerase/dehydratase family protein [Pseudomonadota bacterium]